MQWFCPEWPSSSLHVWSVCIGLGYTSGEKTGPWLAQAGLCHCTGLCYFESQVLGAYGSLAETESKARSKSQVLTVIPAVGGLAALGRRPLSTITRTLFLRTCPRVSLAQILISEADSTRKDRRKLRGLLRHEEWAFSVTLHSVT